MQSLTLLHTKKAISSTCPSTQELTTFFLSLHSSSLAGTGIDQNDRTWICPKLNSASSGVTLMLWQWILLESQPESYYGAWEKKLSIRINMCQSVARKPNISWRRSGCRSRNAVQALFVLIKLCYQFCVLHRYALTHDCELCYQYLGCSNDFIFVFCCCCLCLQDVMLCDFFFCSETEGYISFGDPIVLNGWCVHVLCRSLLDLR